MVIAANKMLEATMVVMVLEFQLYRTSISRCYLGDFAVKATKMVVIVPTLL